MMIKFNTIAAVAASVMLLSAGAFAAQPADGQQPYENASAPEHSTTTRKAVEADAAKHMPADGVQNSKSTASSGKALTRAQVKSQTKAAEKAKGGFADASGEQNK